MNCIFVKSHLMLCIAVDNTNFMGVQFTIVYINYALNAQRIYESMNIFLALSDIIDMQFKDPFRFTVFE